MNSSSPTRRLRVRYAGLLALALVGLLAQRYATVWGGGVSPDSTQYVEGARSLLRGEGISAPDGAGTPRPITLWPPLMSLVMAAPGLLGVEPAEAGSWLNGLLFAANILLVGHIIARATGASSAVWVGAALVLLSPDLFEVHTWVWSEPLFILLTLVALTELAAYLQHPGPRQFWLAAAAAGLAGFTRFAGAALAPAGIGLILLLARIPNLRRRLTAAASFGMVALGPLALWMARNSLVAGSATTRQLGFHRLYSVHILPAWETAVAWVFPGGDAHAGLQAVMLGLLLVGLLWGVLHTLRPGPNHQMQASELRWLPLCLVVFLSWYGAVLLFSKFFVDPLFPLGDRILSPALAALILAWVLVAWHELHRVAGPMPTQPRSGWIRVAQGILLGFVLIQLGLGARQGIAWAAMAHEEGLGFNSRSWQRSPLVAFVRQLPQEAVVHSNADDGLHYTTGRPVWQLPVPTGGSPRPDWVDLVLARSDGRPSYVVYFDAVTWRETVTMDDIRENFRFEKVLRPEEGSVLQIWPME